MDADQGQADQQQPCIGRLINILLIDPARDKYPDRYPVYKGDPFVEEAEAFKEKLEDLRQKDMDRRRENEQQRRQRMQKERAQAFLRTPIGRLVAQAARIREQDKSQDAPSDQIQEKLAFKDASTPDQREQ